VNPSPKDRQNSGISMLEKEQAAKHLDTAIRNLMNVARLGPMPAVEEIRTAMAILDM